MEPITATLLEILRIPSVTGEERALCDYVEERLRRQWDGRGGEILRVQNSVILVGPQKPERPTLGFAGHLDTVPGDPADHVTRVEGHKIYGLGATDMKCGVAVMLELATPAVAEQSPYNLLFVFYAREEGDYRTNEIHSVLATCGHILSKANLFIVPEPTDSAVYFGALGVINATVRWRGTRAHSGSPWLGQNAITRSIPTLERLSSFKPRKIINGGFEFTEVLSVTQLRTVDNARNIIPDLVEANINIRIAPGTTTDAGRGYLEELVKGEAEIDIVDEAPSAPVLTENRMVDRLVSRYGLERRAMPAYTDVAVFALHGIPAINFGPGLISQAHKRGEYVVREHLDRFHTWMHEFLVKGI